MAAPIAHYSASYRAGDFLFISGQIGISGSKLVSDDVEEQARQCLENLAAEAANAGAELTDIVKCTVFMTDIANFSKINAVYAQAFGEHRPARSAIAVSGLPLGALVEIEGFAYLPAGR